MQKAFFHQFNENLFHADHVRGVIGETLRLEDAYMLGKILGTISKHEKAERAIIGYDENPTSAMLEKELARGLVTAGIKVMSIGDCTASMLSFLDVELEPGLSIMIGGNYAPNENGFRIMLHERPFYGLELRRIPKIGMAGNWRNAEGGSYITGSGNLAYIKRILSTTSHIHDELTSIWYSNAYILHDFLPQIQQSLSGNHLHFPVAPGENTTARLGEYLTQQKAHIGFAIDDACQNLQMIDDKGRRIDPDRLTPILLEYLCDAGADSNAADKSWAGKKILLDCLASRTIIDYLRQQKVQVELCNDGQAVFHDRMLQEDFLLGITMEGQFYFNKQLFYGCNDVFICIIKILELASKFYPLSQKIDSMPYSVISPVETIHVKFKKPLDYLADIKPLMDAKSLRYNQTEQHDNHLLVTHEKGWYIIVANNDQQQIKIRAEAQDHDSFNIIRDEMLAILQEADILEIVASAKNNAEPTAEQASS